MHASEAPDGIRIGDVATDVLANPQTMTQRVKAMEKAGLLETAKDPLDRRAKLIRITPAGRVLIEELAPAHVRSVRHRVLDHLDVEDVETLRRVSC